MPRHDRPVQGVLLVAPNHVPIQRNLAGRVCQADECETVLSVYNKKDLCSVHEDFKRVHPNSWYPKPGT